MHTAQALAHKLGIQPSRDSGQHFLVDDAVLARIVVAARIKKKENILEIGPGFGVLTRELIGAGATVVAVEFDRELAAHLAKSLSEEASFKLVRADILSLSNKEIAALFDNEPYRVVANIPYHITGKIIKKFVSSDVPKPTDLALLVQKEVAKRVAASPGDLSLLALSVQLYGEPSVGFTVPKESFWPVPKVDSSLLLIAGVSELPKQPVDEKRFWQVARIGFSNPRKQLRNNLAAGLALSQDQIKEALANAKLKETSRAQELSINDWIHLIDALGEKS